MQHHHIDPIDVRAPQYWPNEVADEAQRPLIAQRLRHFFFQLSLFISGISVVYLTRASA